MLAIFRGDIEFPMPMLPASMEADAVGSGEDASMLAGKTLPACLVVYIIIVSKEKGASRDVPGFWIGAIDGFCLYRSIEMR